jgi:hypothetical protein
VGWDNATMRRCLVAALLAPCAALLSAGCGAGSSQGTEAARSPAAPTPTVSGQPEARGGGRARTDSGSGEASPSTNPSSPSSSSSGEDSIQTFGSAAAPTERSALKRAAFSFFAAMAARDYAKVCGGLAAPSVRRLQAFLKAQHKSGGCPAILRSLIPKAVPAARRAVQGSLTAVRVKGDTAFVLFRPKGGPASYFALEREGPAWKAISLAPGAPLAPLAG